MSRRVGTGRPSKVILERLWVKCSSIKGRLFAVQRTPDQDDSALGYGGRGFAGMMAHPVLGLFLSRGNLSGSEPGGEQGNARLAGFISTSLSQDRPKIGPHGVGRHAATRPIAVAQHGLSGSIPLLGSQGKPAYCLTVVLRDLVAGPVAYTHVKLRGGVAAVSQSLQSLQFVGRRRGRGDKLWRRESNVGSPSVRFPMLGHPQHGEQNRHEDTNQEEIAGAREVRNGEVGRSLHGKFIVNAGCGTARGRCWGACTQ